MTVSEFLAQLDSIIECDSGTMRMETRLADVAQWDSLAVLGFMAWVDEKCGIFLSARDLAACASVQDLAALLGDRITAS